MNNKRYKLNWDDEIKQNWLEENHFVWDEPHSMYIRRFTVWRLSETASVYAEVRLKLDARQVELDLYEDRKTFYGPWYYSEWTNEDDPDIEIINRRIKDEFDRMGIVEDLERSKPVPELHSMEFFEERRKLC